MFDNLYDTFKEILLYVPKKLYQLLLDSLASVIESIPLPSFVYDATYSASNLSPDVMYFLQPFELPTAMAIFLSSYGLRFLIRRMPFIG